MKTEKKRKETETSFQSLKETLEIAQSKLAVYEENPAFSRYSRNDLQELELVGVEELTEKISELEKALKELQ